MTRINELVELGQSIWVDYMRRAFIESGGLQALIDQGVRGVTSNPSIFEKAIAGSTDYDDELRELVEQGKSVDEIYESLVFEDIGGAADLFRPVYDRTAGMDGYVSLEVNPNLANDTEGTITEARRLFTQLGRPNVMIKVPATPAGIPAIEALIADGISVNVTLVFSLAHYDVVAEAYITGLERLVRSDGDPSQVASVASFFVSRVDSAVDRILERVGAAELLGQIAIANARAAYARFRTKFSGERWEELAAKGARVQRPLWASTSAKNPLYPDTLYVDGLIGANTVNTVPPVTLNAFLDHGTVALTVGAAADAALAKLERLDQLGVDLKAVTQKLQDEGVAKFAQSFEVLMASIAEKRDRLLSEWEHMSTSLGSDRDIVDVAVAEMIEDQIPRRIWAHDHTVWKPEPKEITNRLGWLHIAPAMSENEAHLQDLVESVRADGYTRALLLGMGGSSLAPEVFSRTFGVTDGYLDLTVLDSTDPAAVLAHAERLDFQRTLFIVATKSGGTVETLSFFKYFYNRTLEAVSARQAGRHFVAITDPGTALADLAERHSFRALFLNDPNIGGRYSALSFFGLVPAALLGVDVPLLLERAMTVGCACEPCVRACDNEGLTLGAVLGKMAELGRDKVTFVTSPVLSSFGDWAEQLLAESTGKEGRGILPVVGEPVGAAEVYGDDRMFVQLRVAGDDFDGDALAHLEAAGHPVVRLNIADRYDLGGQFFLWEMATVVASHLLGVNPFDQPNVESAKLLARKMMAEYRHSGVLPAGQSESATAEGLSAFLAQARTGAYVALHAYLQPTPSTDQALLKLRTSIRDRTHLATTVGYGPRFLHSTGQLHKGDGGRGLFIQLTADDTIDAAIPDEPGSPQSSISFSALKAAQAEGDRRALLDARRPVIRFHLGADVRGGLAQLAEGS